MSDFRGVFHFTDGSTVDTRPKLEDKTATANGRYTPPAGKDGFGSFTVAVPTPPPTPSDPEALYPVPVVTGFTDAFRLRVGDKRDLSARFKAGQTVVIIPTEIRHRISTDSFIDFSNQATNYRCFYDFSQSGGTLTVKIVKRNKYAPHSTVSLTSGNTYGWYAARFSPSTSAVSYTILCNADGGKITGSAFTTLYATETNWGYADSVANSLGTEAVVIIYPGSVSDADLETLATQYNGTPSATKYWSLIVDDTRSPALTALDTVFTPYGVKPAFAVRWDFAGNYVNMEAVQGLHAKGCEIFYHGMNHDSHGWGTAYREATQTEKEDDLDRFQELMYTHGITVRGFAGPNMAPLIDSRRNRYYYGRPMSSNAPDHGTGAFCDFTSFWLDQLGTEDSTCYADAVALADSISAGWLSFSCHSQCFDGGSVSYPDSGKTAYAAIFIERMQALMEYLASHGWVYLSPAETFRKTFARYGDLGWATPQHILAGTETRPYYLVSGDGTVRHS